MLQEDSLEMLQEESSEESLEIVQEEGSLEMLQEDTPEESLEEESFDISPEESGITQDEFDVLSPPGEDVEEFDVLAGAVIDEPDLPAEISEDPLPELDELTEDISIDMGTESADELEQVIPEGFVVDNDESALSLDDDLDIAETADDLINDETKFSGEEIPSGIKNELKTVLSYMDQLLESLPEEKIEEFAKSEYFDTYKKLFKELGLV
jgi:hypothetical protein